MITTHVLDTSRGGPAVGVVVVLEAQMAGEWLVVGRGTTDRQGRLTTLTEDYAPAPGAHRLIFDVGTYHRDQGIAAPFYPEAIVTFDVGDVDDHYHLPLLLSPLGYSTYRGA